jgi:hypothetical protein
MGNGIVEQMEALIKGTVSPEDLAEIERVIQEAKGKIQSSNEQGFWEGKSPCWEMANCPSSIHKDCPAFKKRDLPCWEVEGTYCKLDDYGATGRDTSICQVCRVYKRFGNGENIKIKRFGEGFNPTFASAKEKVQGAANGN